MFKNSEVPEADIQSDSDGIVVCPELVLKKCLFRDMSLAVTKINEKCCSSIETT